MSKKTKAAPTSTVACALDTRLASELDNLTRVTAKAVKLVKEGDTELALCANIDASINALTLTRALLKDTDAEKKVALDKVVPKDVKDRVEAVETEAKRIKAAAEALEKRLAAALQGEIFAKRITENMTSEAGCQLILQHRKELVIDDASAIPDAYTKRVPDPKLIEEALKDWEVRCSAADVLKLPRPACPVPGARIGTKIVMVTKAPELIEE